VALFPDEACTPEKVTLNDHAVEAPHVLRWVFTAEPGLIKKDVELHEITICRAGLLEKNEMWSSYVSVLVLYNSHICSIS